MSEVLPADSGVGTLAVFMASSGSTDIANRNSPATPPNTLNLRSSHNELLNAEIKHSDAKNSTPPKCRKKYALTNIQAAMGLSDPAVQPLLGNGSANIKLVKNGENQLRKAAEQGQQDPNKNLSPAAVINLTSEKLEVKDPHPQESSGCEILPSQPRRTKSFLNYYADLETSARELGQNLGPCQGVGEEKAQPGPGQAPVVIGNGDLLPQKPNKPQSSPEDGQVATVSSSPETKKDHPKTGAKTDCALHRIHSLEQPGQQTLISLKSSELDEDEGFGDWSQKPEPRQQFWGNEGTAEGTEPSQSERPEEKQTEESSHQAKVHLEESNLSYREPDPEDAVGGSGEAEEHLIRHQVRTPSPLALEDTVELSSPPLSPTTKLADRTESLNRSIKKSNSVKKSQPTLPISTIDERLQQYTQATESSGRTPKLSRQPSIELPSMAVASTKTLWETGEVQSQSASKTPSCQSTPSGKRYKFVATGHGKYEKVLVDEGSAP